MTQMADETPIRVDLVEAAPTLPPPKPNPIRPERMAMVFFGLFAALIVFGVIRVLAAYVTPIILGGILVTLTYKLYRRLRAKLNGRENLAAMLMILGVTLLVILPALVLSMVLIDQASDVFQRFENTDMKTVLARVQVSERLSFLKRFGVDPAKLDLERSVATAIKRIPALVATRGGQLLAGFANAIIGFFIMLFAMFFLYTEGDRLIREIKLLSPLPDKYDQEIFGKFKDVVDATFRGQMLTALAQGAVTGIGFMIAGLPGGVFWGAIAALFAVLPMVGAATIWVPGTIYLFIAASGGDTPMWKAIFLLVWGIGVVSTIDNVVRPWAMKGKADLSAVILLISILGGLKAFGLLGLILGPLLFAMFVTVVHIYKNFFRRPLEQQNVPVGGQTRQVTP